MELTKEALMKGVLGHDDRVELMIEFQLWVMACEEMFKYNLQEDYIDELRAKAPSWINNDIEKAIRTQQFKK